VLDAVGEAVFTSDVISINGLDDRRMTRGVLAEAQRLMADAVHTDHTFFSTAAARCRSRARWCPSRARTRSCWSRASRTRR
jgi:arginine/lysine/ornithine decarboxylase